MPPEDWAIVDDNIDDCISMSSLIRLHDLAMCIDAIPTTILTAVVPEISPHRKLLRDRVKLIRALRDAPDGQFAKSYEEQQKLRSLNKIIRQDVDSHFLSFSQEDKGMISYASKTQHKFDNDKRYKTTLGRYVRKQLKIDDDTISDRTLETLSYAVFGELADPDDLPIKVITGKDITQAYDNSLGGCTCMCGECSKYTVIYEMNPDKVAMVVYDGKARALLWTTDEGAVILDRIYPNDGSHIRAMHKWAKSKGYLVRNNNHCGDCDSSRLLGRDQYHVTLKHNDVFPYMDTFMHGQIRDGHIVVSNLPIGDNDVFLQGQNGTYYTGIECCHCDEHIPEDEVYNINGDNYCEDCYSDRFSMCGRCGSEVDRDDTYEVDSESWCENCHDEHSSSCEGCGKNHSETYEGDDGCLRCEDCHNRYEESQVESTPVT